VLTQLLSGHVDLTIAYFWLVGLVIAITFHEAAHALAADRLGDLTPRYMGRLTLNPLAHLDPVGTILILLVGFGWGKPVTFNPLALRNSVTGAAIISLAGPVTNLLLAIVFSQLIRFQVEPIALWTQIAYINIILAIFNLIPIAPLDGEKILAALLPLELRSTLASLQQYGIIFLIAIIFIAGPFIAALSNFILSLLSGQIF